MMAIDAFLLRDEGKVIPLVHMCVCICMSAYVPWSQKVQQRNWGTAQMGLFCPEEGQGRKLASTLQMSSTVHGFLEKGKFYF